MRTTLFLFTAAAWLLPCGILSAEELPGPIAHYAFDEGAGEVVHDRSGHGHDGVITGAQWTTHNGVPGLAFDGAGDYVDLGDTDALRGTGDGAVAAWFLLDASPHPDDATNWAVVDCEEYRKSGFVLRVDGGASKVMYRASREGSDRYVFGKTTLANRSIAQVVVVRRGAQVDLYVNGRLDGQVTSEPPAAGNGPVYLSAPAQSFSGVMFDVQFFERALEGAEVINLYRSGAARFGTELASEPLRLTPHLYYADREAVAEVDFFGLLPLANEERLVVNLLRGDSVIESKQVDAASLSGQADFPFQLANLEDGGYALCAELTGSARATKVSRAFTLPSPSYALPSPEESAVEPLAAPAPPFSYTMQYSTRGGLTASAGAYAVQVESRFSVPGGGWNTLTCAADAPAAGDWQVLPALVERSNYAVMAQCAEYALARTYTVEPERVVIRDTLRNLSAEPLGIEICHRVSGLPAEGTTACIGGRATGRALPERAIHRSPTLLLSRDGLGVGVVPLDDVFIVQSRGAYDGAGSVELSTREFAVAPGAEYALEWGVYLDGTGDYYDLVNAIRRTEGRNGVRLDGALACLQGTQQRRDVSLVPGADYFALRNAAYATVFCLSWCIDDPAISNEGIEFTQYPKERAQIRAMMDKLYETRPGIKGMFHIAHQLCATNTPENLFPDSRVLDAAGNQVVYPYDYANGSYFSKERYDANWRWWIYYPTMENSFGRAMLDSVDVMMDDMKCRGAFADGFLWGYGAEYTYDCWDGHSADIDPATHTLTRKKGSVLLLTQEAMAAWSRKIQAKGGVVIGNGVVPTRTLGRMGIITDKEVTEGPDVPLLPTPATLGDPSLCGTEEGLYRDVLNKLRWGNLYFYYNDPVELKHPPIVREMYPITVEEIHGGCVKGSERIVTMNSGVFGWPGSRELHQVFRFDARGRAIPPECVTTIDAACARTRLDLRKDEAAVVVRIPVAIETDAPVNAAVMQCDADATVVLLNGRGPVTITGPGGASTTLDLDGPREVKLPGVPPIQAG